MRIDVPDPEYTSSPRARANFRLALRLALAAAAVLWAIELANEGLGLDLARLGVRPREIAGLAGIVLAPLLHGGPAHLVANSLPLVVLGTGMLYLYPGAAFKVLPAVYAGPGIAVWLLGPGGTVHIGASGVVYGLFSYLLVSGVIRLDRRAIAAALLVSFLYGTMVWGVLPIEPGTSWQTHLAAAIIGAVMAVAFRHRDIPPRKHYSWEDESEPADDAGEDAGRR